MALISSTYYQLGAQKPLTFFYERILLQKFNHIWVNDTGVRTQKIEVSPILEPRPKVLISSVWYFKRSRLYVKSRSSKNPGLDKSNLPQNSNFGREIVQKSGVQIPAPEGQKILFFFLFIFKFFTQKWISFI